VLVEIARWREFGPKTSPKSLWLLLRKAVRTALDDTLKTQAVAQKLVMDRLLPISTFEKAVDSREKINIVINTIRPETEAIEGEVNDY